MSDLGRPLRGRIVIVRRMTYIYGKGAPRPPTPRPEWDEQSRTIHALNTVLLPVESRPDGVPVGISEVATRAAAALLAVQNGVGYRAGLTASTAGRSWDDQYAHALEMLVTLERLVRPALVKGRKLAAQLANELAEAERAEAEAAAEAARQARIEAAVQDEVDAAEQRRLDEIATEARARVLAKTGAQQ